MSMRLLTVIGLLILLLSGWTSVEAYPLDGASYTGIARLEGYRLAQEGKVRGRRLPAGAMLGMDQVDLRLRDYPDLDIPPVDPEFTAKIRELFGTEEDRYAVAVLDLTNPKRPRYAEHRGSASYNPGSVGKLAVIMALFQALRDIYPNDLEARLRVLRTSQVTADAFIKTDLHKVPFWHPGASALAYRRLQQGDRANLWTYLDWMLSASSNAAASMSIRELMLLVHFGDRYPLSDPDIERFFRESSKGDLSALLQGALQDPISRNGLHIDQFRQGGFFTREGKRRVPGTNSYANPRELLKFLLLLEQGKIVDDFSSREIKRLLYMTERRIRYASSPALSKAAVYFKSGSLYRCKPEPGFRCLKYHGNVLNLLNSVAIIESPAGERRLYYMVTVMSDVLRKNSAVVHQTLATRIHRLIESYYQDGKPESESVQAGRSDRQGRQ